MILITQPRVVLYGCDPMRALEVMAQAVEKNV